MLNKDNFDIIRIFSYIFIYNAIKFFNVGMYLIAFMVLLLTIMQGNYLKVFFLIVWLVIYSNIFKIFFWRVLLEIKEEIEKEEAMKNKKYSFQDFNNNENV